MLNRSPWPTYRRWLIDLAVFAVVIVVFMNIPMRVDNYFWLSLNAAWVSVITMIIFFGVSSLTEPSSRKVALRYLSSALTKRENK